MWRFWLIFDPRRALVVLGVFLFSLAVLLHFIVLSTDRYSWIEGSAQARAAAAQTAPPAVPAPTAPK